MNPASAPASLREQVRCKRIGTSFGLPLAPQTRGDGVDSIRSPSTNVGYCHATMGSVRCGRKLGRSKCVAVIPMPILAHEAAVFAHAYRGSAADAIAGDEFHFRRIRASDGVPQDA